MSKATISILSLLMLTVACVLVGCKSHSSGDLDNLHWQVDMNGSELILQGDTCRDLAVTLSFEGATQYDTIMENYSHMVRFNIDELILRQPQHFYKIAYGLACDGKLALNVKVGSTLDTIVNYVPELGSMEQLHQISAEEHNGRFAPVLPANVQSAMSWAKAQELPLSREHAFRMNAILRRFSSVHTQEYVRDSMQVHIPLYTTFKDMTFKIDTDMRADHYFLFATNSDSELSGIIKTIRDNNYVNTVIYTDRPMECYRGQNSRGTCVVMLIGFNRIEGTYQVCPVGLVCLDPNPIVKMSEEKFLQSEPGSTSESDGDDIPLSLSFAMQHINVTVPNARSAATPSTIAVSRGRINELGEQQLIIRWRGELDHISYDAPNYIEDAPQTSAEGDTQPETIDLKKENSPLRVSVPAHAILNVYDINGNSIQIKDN